MASISKRHVEFYNTFCEVENICRAKLGVLSGGVRSYIERLKSTRYALNREEILKRLARYDAAADYIGNERGDEESIVGISKMDIKWLKRFKRLLVKKQDTLSRYLRRAHKPSKIRRFFAVVLLVILFIIASLGIGYAAHVFGIYDRLAELFGWIGKMLTDIFVKVKDFFVGLFTR
jgi:hypothetical protein